MSEAGAGQEREYIELIMGRVDHLDGVYTGLIEFMNVKERQPSLAQVSLAHLKQTLLSSLAQKHAALPIQIHFDLPQNVQVKTDEFLLHAILKVLLLNAIDFRDAAKSAECTVRFYQDAGGWGMEVRDNGLGIAPEFLPKAFDMFARGSNRSRGSGLGLYTARLAATKLGGRLELHSEAGKGTVARLWVGA
jgi:signal transduction histidine kinase